MKAIAFDAMGVLYQVHDDMRQLLIPFARAHGSTLRDGAIHSTYRRAMMGALTTTELWSELDVVGNVGDLNREYLEGYRLVPGIHALLDQLLGRGVELGCISNDVGEWSLARRAAHELDRRIRNWTISSDVHVRKPDAGIYQAFLMRSRLLPEEVVFVDDRAVNVQAATELGFTAILVDFAGLGSDPRALPTPDELGRVLNSIA